MFSWRIILLGFVISAVGFILWQLAHFDRDKHIEQNDDLRMDQHDDLPRNQTGWGEYLIIVGLCVMGYGMGWF